MTFLLTEGNSGPLASKYSQSWRKQFRLVTISGVDVGDIGFGLLFNNDWCRRCRRRNRWRILYQRRYSGLVPKMDSVGKVLRFKHLVERFRLNMEKLELSSDVVVSGHDCGREDSFGFGFGCRVGGSGI